MSRKTKEEAEKTRARILASALSLFVKKGYDHTTFTDIAERLKMTKGAVYWHFESKETLLMALVDEMLAKFRRHLGEMTPAAGLTFPAVADVLVSRALRIVEDPKGASFFLLLQTQVRWGADSMAKIREQLLSHDTEGPYHYVIRAIESDIAAGRVRKDVNPVAIASVSISVWTGLMKAKIEKFLQCDLESTLSKTYRAMWQAIRTV